MATHTSILAWRIPGTEAAQATVRGVARVGHDSATKPTNHKHKDFPFKVLTYFLVSLFKVLLSFLLLLTFLSLNILKSSHEERAELVWYKVPLNTPAPTARTDSGVWGVGTKSVASLH